VLGEASEVHRYTKAFDRHRLTIEYARTKKEPTHPVA
jgi:hypothetical protein